MDLKALREYKLKMTRAEFAQCIGEREVDVENWEATGEPPLAVIQKITQKTGLDFNTVLGYEKPVPQVIKLDNTWEKVESTKKSLIRYIADALDKIAVPTAQREAYIEGLQQYIANNLVKPKVTIVGRSDTGKSTLINALLGEEKMPTSWTPTTTIAVYIKHISDKPPFIPTEENAWIFANQYNEEKLWDVRRLNDEEYCRNWKIAAGDVDILHTYGIRQDVAHAFEAGSAVVFVDAPILKNCDIVDLPGFGTETESDDSITLKATQGADVIVYLSQANGFMRREDIDYLKGNIKALPVFEKQEKNQLPPLSNLFIVASQAHTINVGNVNQLDTILRTGCENLVKTLPPRYWFGKQISSGYSEEKYENDFLPTRFFTYTTDIPDLCERFNNELSRVLETLPEIIIDNAKENISAYISERMPNLQAEIKKYEDMSKERDKYADLLRDIDDNELTRIEDNNRSKKNVLDKIEELYGASLQEFHLFCARRVNVDAIVEQLKEKKIKNKKEEVELFASQFQSTIQQKVETILSEKSQELSESTKEYLEEFSRSVNRTYSDSSLHADFDVGWAFTSALSKIGILGGMGAFVLGEAAWALLPLGAVIGLAGDVAIIASLLGPLGVVAGLAIGGALGLVKLVGGGWEKNVAKKLVKAFEENQVQEKYKAAIDTYWEETKQAFNSAAQALDLEWTAYVENMRKIVQEYDEQDLEDLLAGLRCLKHIFDNWEKYEEEHGNA